MIIDEKNYFIYYNEHHNEFAIMRMDHSFVFASTDYYVAVQYADEMGLTFSLDSNFIQ